MKKLEPKKEILYLIDMISHRDGNLGGSWEIRVDIWISRISFGSIFTFDRAREGPPGRPHPPFYCSEWRKIRLPKCGPYGYIIGTFQSIYTQFYLSVRPDIAHPGGHDFPIGLGLYISYTFQKLLSNFCCGSFLRYHADIRMMHFDACH